MLHYAVSALAALICLAIAALLWVVAEKRAAVAIVLLILAGATGIAGTKVGGWINTGVTWADHGIGGLIGMLTGVVFGFLLAIAVAFIFVHDLVGLIRDLFRKRDGNVENRTVVAAALVPFTAAAIPGTVGALMVTIVGFLASLPAWGISALFGIH